MKPGYQTTLADGLRATRRPGPDEPTIGEVVDYGPRTTIHASPARAARTRAAKTKQPTASMVRDTPGVCIVWLVQWPHTVHKWGKSYYATTYPNSDLVFIETSAKRRPVSPLVGRRITPIIKASIERARA